MAQPRNKPPWGPIALVVAVLALAGIAYVAMQDDDPIEEMVDDIGDAARDAGDAIDDTVDDLTDP